MYEVSKIGNHKIILFDGFCNLCNGVVLFLIKRDKKRLFKYSSLQSETGIALTKEFHIDTLTIDSFVLIDKDQFYIKSTAALLIFKQLGFPWNMLYVFIVVPKFMRDSVYDYIAKHRYKWFGKKEICIIPTPELKSLFLD